MRLLRAAAALWNPRSRRRGIEVYRSKSDAWSVEHALQLDLEVRPLVAVGVDLDEGVVALGFIPDLALLSGEGGLADEVERLVPFFRSMRLRSIVSPWPDLKSKIVSRRVSARLPPPRIRELFVTEGVGAASALELVAVVASEQEVVAAAAEQVVLPALAEKLVVCSPTFQGIVAAATQDRPINHPLASAEDVGAVAERDVAPDEAVVNHLPRDRSP